MPLGTVKTNANHSIFTFRISNALKKPDYSAITNRFAQVSNTSENLSREGEFFLTDIAGGVNISIANSKLSQTNANGFKQWLQANNVTVVYQLAQEEVYECTNIDLITYENETNYIVSSGAISPKSVLKVHNNISNVVRVLQQKVSLLENKFIEGLKQVLAGDMYSLAELLYPEDFKAENSVMTIPLD